MRKKAVKSQGPYFSHPEQGFLVEKLRCKYLMTGSVTNAEIWMSGNLISDDSLLWGLNVLKEIPYIKKFTNSLGILIMAHVHNLSKCLQAKCV